MLQILAAPFIAAALAQLIKLFVKSNSLKWDWDSITSYSGMPSSHAAMAVSLAASVGLNEGFNSALFAVAVISGFFIIRDAMGVRRYVGQHGEILNRLISDLKRNKINLNENYPRLIEKIGHTPAQIIAGAALGFLISLAAFFLF